LSRTECITKSIPAILFYLFNIHAVFNFIIDKYKQYTMSEWSECRA